MSFSEDGDHVDPGPRCGPGSAGFQGGLFCGISTKQLTELTVLLYIKTQIISLLYL